MARKAQKIQGSAPNVTPGGPKTPGRPWEVADMGVYGNANPADRYLFGSEDEAASFRSPDKKYVSAPSEDEHVKPFHAIKPGMTAQSANDPTLTHYTPHGKTGHKTGARFDRYTK